jgi:uncharacterized protein YceK
MNQKRCGVYGGVRSDCRAIYEFATTPPHCVPPVLLIPMLAVDLPFSMVGDTVTLPLTVSCSMRRWLDADRKGENDGR